ncbi:hypothetical protein B0H14DRAFT_3896148 [Mycena olivaceomarginata]|nr:hypothetical protein B0H14DRAFT_3896148 [Mycena olivaceomarginata]
MEASSQPTTSLVPPTPLVHKPSAQGGCFNTALISTSTADDRISSPPYAIQCMQPRSLEPAPTSQSIASRCSSPRAAQPYLDSRAIPMRFPTTHTVVRGGAPTPRYSSADVAAAVWLLETTRGRVSRDPSCRAIFVLLEDGTPRALAERLSIPLLRRLGPGTVDAVAFWRVSGRGTWMHRCPSRAILRHPSSRSCCIPTSRALHASVLYCCSVHRRSSTPPQVAAEKISRDGAERSKRWPQVPKQLSLGLDYTNRPTVFSPPSVHLIYTAQGTGAHLHPVPLVGLFATHLISSRRALPHLDYATMRFRGDAGSRRCACAAAGPAGSGSFWGSLLPCNYSYGVFIRPSRISTVRRGVRGGAFALQLGDVHAAPWVFGTPQTVYRACGIHFTLLQAR